MLFVWLMLACAGSGDTDYECGVTDDPEIGYTGTDLRQWCGQAGQDVACGTDRGYAELADMDAKEIGEKYFCEPARVAGEHCLDLIEIAEAETSEEVCEGISGTE